MTQKKARPQPSNGNSPNKKGGINWASSVYTYELKREKIEFNLDTTLVKRLGEFEKYLIDTDEEGRTPHKSGIVEEVLSNLFKENEAFLNWSKSRAKKVEDEAKNKPGDELETEGDLLEGVGKTRQPNQQKPGAPASSVGT